MREEDYSLKIPIVIVVIITGSLVGFAYLQGFAVIGYQNSALRCKAMVDKLIQTCKAEVNGSSKCTVALEMQRTCVMYEILTIAKYVNQETGKKVTKFDDVLNSRFNGVLKTAYDEQKDRIEEKLRLAALERKQRMKDYRCQLYGVC